MNLEKFKCLKCNKESYVSDWLTQTESDLEKEGVFEDEYSSLPKISVDMINKKECFYYQCPECYESCFVEDGHISYTADSQYIIDKVSKEHIKKEDIEEGSLLEEISQYPEYELDNISIEDIMYESCEFNEEIVNDYADELYETMPAIILHPIDDDRYKYRVIDGVHRIRARARNEYEDEIWAFIPKL